MLRALETTTKTTAPYARLRDLAMFDPVGLFVDSLEDRASSSPHVSLSIELGSGTSMRQEVTLTLGVTNVAAAELTLPLAWQPVGRSRVLPTFSGSLTAVSSSSGTALRLSGTYAVPLGLIGRVVDRVVGRRVAQRSLHVLLAEIGKRLDTQVQAPHPVRELTERCGDQELRECEHPEIYIG